MEVRFWAATDTGRKRGHNEDNFLVDRGLRLFVVCDGMGGHAAGEVASAAAIQTIRDVVEEGSSSMVEGAGLDRTWGDEEAVMELLGRAVRKASRRIWEMGQDDESRRGMGTTCSLIMFVGDRGFLAHVGDSRVYRMRAGGVTQLTDDHSLRNHLIREGKLEEDERLDRENAVTRAVGVAESIEVDTFAIDLQPGDRFVLCSDGLTEYLGEPDLLLEIASEEDLEAATDACIDHANRSGGKDNVTALLVEVDEGQGVWDARQSTPAGRALRVLPHFEHLTVDEFGAVAERIEMRQVEPGTTVAEADQAPEELILVVEGEIELSKEDDVVDVIRPGDFFGERALLGAAQAGLAAEAVEPTTVAVLSKSGFEAILAESDQLAAKVSWNFLVRLTGKLQHLDEIQFRNPQLASLAQPSDEKDLEDTDDFSDEARSAKKSVDDRPSPTPSTEKTAEVETVSDSPDRPSSTRKIGETTADLPDDFDVTRRSAGRRGGDSETEDGDRSGADDSGGDEIGPPGFDPNEDTLVPGDEDGGGESARGEDTGRASSGAQVLKKKDEATNEDDEEAAEADESVEDVDEAARETVQMKKNEVDPESFDRD